MKLERVLVACLLLPTLIRAADEPTVVRLWTGDAPGSEGKTAEEIVEPPKQGQNFLKVSSIHKPSLTVYLPPKEKATGAAVIIAPGGGHSLLAMDHEGYNVGKWMSEHGVAGFVLKYRLAREKGSTYTIQGNAVPDMQRAIRLVRNRAAEWNVNPSRVGVMGFSAGGELAFWASMNYDNGIEGAADPVDRQGCKPDFQALIYPGTSGKIIPTSNSPPVFLACGFKDRKDISEGLAEVYLKFKQVGVPAELHIFAGAGHGFGYRESNLAPAGKWPERFLEWLDDRGFLKKP